MFHCAIGLVLSGSGCDFPNFLSLDQTDTYFNLFQLKLYSSLIHRSQMKWWESDRDFIIIFKKLCNIVFIIRFLPINIMTKFAAPYFSISRIQ